MQIVNNTLLIDGNAVAQLLWRFVFNFIVVGVIIHFFYYPKSRRRDYYFTFSLINISVFLLIILMGSVKIKVGFALGIFAIFGIIRYRTESVPIREMTYLFVIIAISVVNALAIQLSLAELLIANALFVFSVWLLENERWLKHVSCKLVLYDKIHLITPDKREELIADLQKRIGIEISKVEIGHIDFLRDAVYIKVYYESKTREINTVDMIERLPRESDRF
ncbi:MAG: DUF4956 domain-containing protein [Tannerella sp.]|nr:DUF4956 domain-containing protein [Tannerella sp.]